MAPPNVIQGFGTNSSNWLWKGQIKPIYVSADWLLCHLSYPASCCSFTLSSYIVVRLIGAMMDGVMVEKQSWWLAMQAHQMTYRKKCSLSGQSCSWFCNSTFASVKHSLVVNTWSSGGWRNEGLNPFVFCKKASPHLDLWEMFYMFLFFWFNLFTVSCQFVWHTCLQYCNQTQQPCSE